MANAKPRMESPPRMKMHSNTIKVLSEVLMVRASLGVELKVERGRRVFPVSDKAEEIRQALLDRKSVV